MEQTVEQMIEEYYRENRNLLLKTTQRRGMQEADADDIVQETFYRVLKYKDGFNPAIQDIGAWINTILFNVHKAYFNANMTGEYCFEEEEYEDEYNRLEDSTLDKDMVERIKKEIAELPASQANIVHCYLVQGFPTKTVQIMFGENKRNIEQIVLRFRKKMREKYGESFE